MGTNTGNTDKNSDILQNGHTRLNDKCRDTPIHANRHMRVICVGAGASGLHLIYKMKREFTNFTLDVYEKNPDIGGTWYENRYPGCACDIPAHNYVYSFEPNPHWSANYASSVEIFNYFSNFTNKYGLRKSIKTQHEVVGAAWIEERASWAVSIRRPDRSVFEQECDWLINGAGILNAWRWPAIPGIDKYKGQLLHSAAWDLTVDVANKHVGLIGNGSSGIQILPKMQEQARHVTTFIREPTWISPTPGMDYRKYTDQEQEDFILHPEKLTELRKASEKAIGEVFSVVFNESAAQKQLEAFIKDKMIEKINNQELARLLIPEFAFGCRRITPGTQYLESLTKPNVTTVYGDIKEITKRGCVTADGKEHPTDILICATGFDTSFRPRFPLRGRNDMNLAEEWALEPRSYLGLAASGYPNYFMYLGPNCPIANGPIIFSIELQTEYMLRFMNRWQKEDIRTFDAKREAVDDFMHQKDLFMERTVWTGDCLSWYKNPRDGRITAVWPGSTLHYMETLATPRYDDYSVEYNGRRFAYLGNGFSQTETTLGMDRTYYIRERDDGSSLFRNLMSKENMSEPMDVKLLGKQEKILLEHK
ncbi:hypothetical protein FNYG_10493 [Fusarium nygamai]|uniref:FAD/NAD(P)-binding domain-containing protein n=1 Tax=Gibberella nygamai TaxID=42673 RepID=A0A2K0W1Q0_GIBNY|nr:hypothetical protein FNYG_10493 [Fusarium nygamai]